MSHSYLSAEGTWTLHKQSQAYLEVPQNEIYPILPSKRYVIAIQLAFINFGVPLNMILIIANDQTLQFKLYPKRKKIIIRQTNHFRSF